MWAEAMGEPASNLPLRLDDVTVSVGEMRLLDRVSLSFKAGAPTAILGPNGSGKTTLLRLAMGLLPPTSGTLQYGILQEPLFERLAMVLQKPVMLRRSAAANIEYALKAAGKRDPAAVARLLDLVGLSALGDRPARRLSGGEQQRLALARALAREPEILLLDEPTASLDPNATRLVEEIVARIAAAGVKVVLATHDLGQARRLAGDVAFLASGCLVEHAATSDFFAGPATQAARRFLAGDLVV